MESASYLVFDEYVTPGKKTKSYGVKNKQSLATLGVIHFWPAWRKYVFESVSDVIFDSKCLAEIVEKLDSLTAEWRANLRK